MAKIKVTDTGRGIEKEKHKKLFRTFGYKGSKKKKEESSGLGLYIVKSLVELHGGKVWLNDTYKNGAEFVFTLFLADVFFQLETIEEESKTQTRLKDTEIKPSKTGASVSDFIESEIRILNIDDNAINIKLTESCLRSAKYKVTSVKSGKEALSLFNKNKKFDILIVDLIMPDMNGFELCKEVRKKYKAHELPILALTARNRQIDFVKSLNAGANDFLTKPYEPEELLHRIRTLLLLSHEQTHKVSMLHEEREKIFKDIHDHMGASLLDAKIILSSLAEGLPEQRHELIRVNDKINTVLEVLKERIRFYENFHRLREDFFGNLKLILLRRYMSVNRIMHFHYNTSLNQNINIYFDEETLYNLFSVFLEICNNDLKYGSNETNWLFEIFNNELLIIFFADSKYEISNKKQGRGSSEIISTIAKMNGVIHQNYDDGKFGMNIKIPIR